MHLSGWPVKTAAALLVPTVEAAAAALLAPTSCATLGAATRFICKSLGSEEFLFSNGEGKFVPAISAGKGLV